MMSPCDPDCGSVCEVEVRYLRIAKHSVYMFARELLLDERRCSRVADRYCVARMITAGDGVIDVSGVPSVIERRIPRADLKSGIGSDKNVHT